MLTRCPNSRHDGSSDFLFFSIMLLGNVLQEEQKAEHLVMGHSSQLSTQWICPNLSGLVVVKTLHL